MTLGKRSPYLKKLDTLRRNWTRRQRAREFGVSFLRGPWFALPDRILLGGRSISLAAPPEKGIRYSFIDIFLDDVYGLRNIGTRIDRILDVGANVGLFSLYARSMFPHAVIHAYEPNRTVCGFLEHQAKEGRFEVYTEAIGLEQAKIRLETGAESVLGRSSMDAAGDVNQIAFAEAVRRIGGEVDLVKLDCEGAEWEILRDRASCRRLKFLALEYHLFAPDTSHAGIRALVEEAGFRIDSQYPGADSGIIHAHSTRLSA